MAMKKEITQVIAGIGLGKGIQALTRYYVDFEVAKAMLYNPTQYAVDLKKAGYVVQAADSTKSDDEIGRVVMSDTGYTFASGPGNLMGTTKQTANKHTYRAAAGQKVAPWMFPSTWLSSVVGGIALAEGATNFTKINFTRTNDVGVASMGASMLMDGVSRGIGIDGTITAPSGFDVSKQPAMQYLGESAVANLKRLSDENSRLQSEIAQLRNMNMNMSRPAHQQPVQTASYRYNAPQPQVTITGQPHVTITPVGGDIIPSRGGEHIKDRMYMMEGIHRATGETVRNNTGLVTLSGGK